MLLTFPLFNNIKIIIIRHREREIVSYKMPDEIIILYYYNKKFTREDLSLMNSLMKLYYNDGDKK